MGRKDLENPWLFARTREVQDSPDGYLDLWAREHYKSTIITFGKTIQDILASHGENPIVEKELTIGIFSHTRPNAKKFLRQIKLELESNRLLQEWFPDVLYPNPGAESPKWSEDMGLMVKRRSNAKEMTVEAWGLVDGQPTGAHFDLLVYDDIVTRESVTSPDMIQKTTEAMELSYNLGAHGGKRRFIGTRYHFNDTYRTILERGTAKARIYPATEDGQVDGEPVLLDREVLAEKRRDMGPYTFACQMMQNPKADETQGFKRDWLRYHKSAGTGMNIYILVDPASEKKKGSDYTAFEVVGLGTDLNYYTLELIRDRLNLKERGDVLFRLHRKWRPLGVGYEKYGMQADIEHIKDRMSRETYHFDIIPLGGGMAKNDRIRRLIPLFEQGRWYLPESCFYTDYEGRTKDLVSVFLAEEYDAFPVSVHDDMFDVKARILDEDLGAIFPKAKEMNDRYQSKRKSGSPWAA